MPPTGGPRYATPETATEAIRALGARERAVLAGAAHAFWRDRVAGAQAWSGPDDLLQEALVRTLTGSRRWRTSVPLAQHLIRTMESLSWEALRAGRARRGDTGLEDVDTAAPRHRKRDSCVEEAAMAQDTWDHLAVLFEQDGEALGVLRCRAMRLSPSETCARLGMERKRYDTVNKRIRRALDRGPRDHREVRR